jgi:hypothetical protein
MAEVDAGASAPVVPVTDAPAANAVPAPDAPTVTDNAEPSKADESVQPPKTYSEEETRRIVNERLTKERKRLAREARAEVERDFYKRQLEERNAPKASDQPKGKPQYKDFEGRPEEYVEALADWKFEQREAKRIEESKAQEDKHSEREEVEQAEMALAKASVKFPDLKARLIEADAFLTKPMFDYVVDTEHGPAVGDFFANNPAESHRIAALSPVKQVLELHKIATRLSAPPEPTKTPAPIKPLDGNAGAKRDWADLSTAEHVEKWLKRKR